MTVIGPNHTYFGVSKIYFGLNNSIKLTFITGEQIFLDNTSVYEVLPEDIVIPNPNL